MRLTWWIGLLAVGISCSTVPEQASVSPETDWVKPEYAEGFQWRTTADGSAVLRLMDLNASSETELMQLTVPADAPFARLACLSTTHLNLLEAGGLLDRAVAGCYLNYVRDPSILKAVESGAIRSLGQQEPDIEILVDERADAYLVYPFGDSDHSALERAGIPVVPISEYLEAHPLGRAEWVRCLGRMCGAATAADSAFFAIEERYQRVQKRFGDAAFRPVVFTGSQDGGVWYAPGGQSFIRHFVEDAGGKYLFDSDGEKRNLTLDMEVLLERAQSADHFGMVLHSEVPIQTERLTAEEPVLAGMPFYPDGLFACNTHASDYFGRAIVEPDVILADLSCILHPERCLDHVPVYFKPVLP